MSKIVEAISNKDFTSATNIFEEAMANLVLQKVEEAKKIVAAKESKNPNMDSENETNELAEARIKIIKARIRGGKVQRRKKVSNVAGYTFRGGKLKRMSPMERRRRKLGQRRGKIKRKAKLQRALMKRKRSLMRRRSIGLG